MRNLNTFTRYNYHNIRNRLAALQRRTLMADTTRQTVQNEIEAAARFWFVQGGGSDAEFETKFNGK